MHEIGRGCTFLGTSATDFVHSCRCQFIVLSEHHISICLDGCILITKKINLYQPLGTNVN